MSYWDDVTAASRTGKSTKNTGTVRKAVTRTPDERVFQRAAGNILNQAHGAINIDQAGQLLNAQLYSAPKPAAASRNNTGGSGSRGYGGGGGGGGMSAAAAAQAQMDYLQQLLGGKSYTAAPLTAQRDALGNLRNTVTTASQQDQAAATSAYNGLDTWLGQNNRNPYADVKLQAAQRAPDMNPYLASQGVGGTNVQASNPDDGGYGAFQNVLALLGANQRAGNQSRLAESQMGRTFAGQQIGAMDNAYLANITQQESGIAQQEAERQMALDTEKRQALMQLAALIGQGAKAPDMAAMGLA